MLNRTRRMLGLARAPSGVPDPPEADELDLVERPQPPWQDDLESLFQVVDSRIIERREIITPPADEHRVSREPAPTPDGGWVGFGLEDLPPAAAGRGSRSIEPLATQILAQVRATLLDGDLADVIRQAARDAVESALRDRLAAEVRAGVEAAMREVQASELARIAEPALAPSTIVSIRFHPRRARHSDPGLLTLKTR